MDVQIKGRTERERELLYDPYIQQAGEQTGLWFCFIPFTVDGEAAGSNFGFTIVLARSKVSVPSLTLPLSL